MAKYAITKEGAMAFARLALQLSQNCESIHMAATRLQVNSDWIEDYDEAMFRDIANLIDGTVASLHNVEEDVLYLTERLNHLAERIMQVSSSLYVGQSSSNYTKQMDTVGYAPLNSSSYVECCFNKRVMQRFREDLYTKTELVRVSDSEKLVYVPAESVFWYDESAEDDEFWNHEFWNHHGYNDNKDFYYNNAKNVDKVFKELSSGKSIDEIKKHPDLRICVETYFTPEKAIRVYQDQAYSGGNRYFFDSGGRHRLRSAQELGITIPVKVSHILKRK